MSSRLRPPPVSRDRVLLGEAGAVALLVTLAYLTLRTTGLFAIGAFNDDGVYVALGQAIAKGQGYRLIYLPGDPPPVAVKFPPGLPALLAVPWLLGGGLHAVRALVGVVQPVICGAAAGTLWWLGRGRLGLSRVVLAVLAIGPLLLAPAIEYYNIALAEPYFVAGWAVALALTVRLVAAPGTRRAGTAVAAGLVLSLTTLFRSAGVVLIPAVLLALVIRRCRARDIGFCALAALLPLVAWSLVHADLMAQGPLSDLPDEQLYWQWLPLERPALVGEYLLQVLPGNSTEYAFQVVRVLSGRPLLGGLGLVAGVAATVLGAGRLFRSRPELVLTVVASLVAIVLWPFAQDRLLFPILPFAGLLAAVGLESVLARGSAKLRSLAAAALAVLAVAVALRQATVRRAANQAVLVGVPLTRMNNSPRYILLRNSRYILGLVGWVRTHTTSGDRLLVPFPTALYLYTGRKAVPSTPAEPGYGPSVYAIPGRYLARRILSDSVTVVAIPSAALLVATDIATIRANCPGVLEWVGVGNPGSYPAIYRVAADHTCLLRYGDATVP